jgi:phage gp45-like
MADAVMRWARVRGLVEGLFQKGRTETLADEARDDAQRPQDYGFAANPVEGQGLALEIGGHTVIIRLDRTAERPQLAEYEVALWHKEGHKITLRSGGVVEISGTDLNINLSGAVAITSASLTHNGKAVGAAHTHGGGPAPD